MRLLYPLQSTPSTPSPSALSRQLHGMVMSSVAGLTAGPSRCCFQLPLGSSASRCSSRRVSNLPGALNPAGNNVMLRPERNSWAGVTQRLNARRTHVIKCAMDASFGDMSDKPTAIFPRIHVMDPYKRLGVSREADDSEIEGAWKFLVRQYGGHKPSKGAIDSAYEKIVMQRYHAKKNPPFDFKKKVRSVGQSRVVQAVRSRFRTPATQFIVKTSVAFVLLGALTFLFPTEEGPTLQVAISLLATIYFVHERLQSKWRAFLYSVGAFVFSWLVGTFLMVAVIPPIPFIKGLRSFEVITSLITYVLLWVASTYLK